MKLRFFNKLKGINWHKLVLELFVVFLGVSSGFVLNNYREVQKEIELEKKYMISFLQNTENNIFDIEKTLKDDTVWLEKMDKIIEIVSDKENMNADSVLKVFSTIVSFTQTDAETNTYEDIKNSGNLNLIRNFELKEMLVKYHKTIENVEFLDKFAFELFQKDFIVFFYDQVDILGLKFVDPQIVHSYVFANKILAYSSIRRLRLPEYDKLLKESQALKIELEKYIDNLK